jgi:hypothetical protein
MPNTFCTNCEKLCSVPARYINDAMCGVCLERNRSSGVGGKVGGKGGKGGEGGALVVRAGGAQHHLHHGNNQNVALMLFGEGGGGNMVTNLPGGGKVAVHKGKQQTHVAAVKGKHAELLTARLKTVNQRPQILFSAAVDVSESMNGGMKTCIDALLDDEGLVATLLEKDDLFGCVTFAERVTKLHHPMPIHKVNRKTDVENITKAHNGVGTGGTAIYDAIRVGIDELKDSVKYIASREQQGRNLVVEHLILTDGSDNRSSLNFDQIQDLVRSPGVANYHLVIIGINMSARDEQKFKNLCVPNHCKYVSASNMSAFRNEILAYQRSVQNRVELSLHVRNGGEQDTTTHWEGRAEDTAAAVARMVGNAGAHMLAGQMMNAFSIGS